MRRLCLVLLLAWSLKWFYTEKSLLDFLNQLGMREGNHVKVIATSQAYGVIYWQGPWPPVLGGGQ